MQCPYCGSAELKVLDTTDIRNGIRRRRECQTCDERFTTYERPLAVMPVLIKQNGNREEFDLEKLKRGIWNACAKRPIPASEIERLAARVETYLQSLGRAEISSQIVGDMVIAGLKALDPIAYIRYAIVYLGLDNLLSVRAEIDKLLAEQQGLLASEGETGSTTSDGAPGGGFAADAETNSKRVHADRPTPEAEPVKVNRRSRRTPSDAGEATTRSNALPEIAAKTAKPGKATPKGLRV
jgi:transcriptional repressor NrdR